MENMTANDYLQMSVKVEKTELEEADEYCIPDIKSILMEENRITENEDPLLSKKYKSEIKIETDDESYNTNARSIYIEEVMIKDDPTSDVKSESGPKPDIKAEDDSSEKSSLLKCNKCNYKARFKSTLKKHQKQHTKRGGIFKCEKCSYTTCLKAHIEKHQIVHQDAKPFQCSECPYRTKRTETLKNHQLRRHTTISEIKKLYCTKCDYITGDLGCLIKHKLVHADPSKVETFTCHTCDYTTKYRANFNRHIMAEHRSIEDLKVFKCKKCTYVTKYSGDLSKHQLVHRDSREVETFQCYTCGYKTKYKSTLTVHIANHRGNKNESEKRFGCTKCKYVTNIKRDLLRHEVLHKDISEVETFQCYTCGYTTRTKKNLIPHMARKHMNQYKCPKCKFIASSSADLAQHKWVHRDRSKAKICHTCGYITRYETELVKHITSEHSLEKEGSS